MSKKTNKRQNLLVETLHFSPDSASMAAFGVKDGYSVIASPGGDDINMGNENFWTLIFSVQSANGIENGIDFSSLRKASKEISAISYQNPRLVVQVKNALKEDKNKENVQKALQDTVEFLRANSFKPVCQISGKIDDLVCGVMNGTYLVANRNELLQKADSTLSEAQSESKKSENVAVGFLGALLGSLIGAATIILIGLLGYVSALSGVIMGIATIGLYKKFASKISVKGVIVSFIAIIIMTYLANRVQWAIEIVKVYKDVPFDLAFVNVPYAIEPSVYNMELIKLYLFVLLGAIITAVNYMRGNKANKVTHIMG